ncbi:MULTISPECIES: hypothetical protein [unclassified Bradyrhizobium]|uniref:hypothetical protein n=1 Tax=unclassified Bradyrhizobium TaxID=2631580 RepID=UPI0028E95C5A|nr:MULTISPECIES: hypothetical protein [unclassified Bradyrhizobium]
MKKIFVDLFTFEVARALHRDLSGISDGDSIPSKRHALVATISALNDLGFLISEYPDGAIWFCFSPKAKDLDQFGSVPDEKLEELISHEIGFKLKRSEVSRSLELSKQYRDDLDDGAVRSSWRGVGAIIDGILRGDLRLLGPEVEDGLILQDLTRSTPEEGHFQWFSLRKPDKRPSLVDIESPKVIKGRPVRIAIGTAAARRNTDGNL